ncbi:hypothetical protein EMIT0P218_20472 [Pseudomonas sp. IT-P218]
MNNFFSQMNYTPFAFHKVLPMSGNS